MAAPACLNPAVSLAGAKSLVHSTQRSLEHRRALLIHCISITIVCRAARQFPRPRCADARLLPNPAPQGSVKAPRLPGSLITQRVTPLTLLQSADASRD